jgi:hypothetical protein
MNVPIATLPRPRWGSAEIAPLSLEQSERMTAEGILSDPGVTWQGGYLWTDSAPPALYRLSLDQYKAMIAVGILGEGDPLELLEGFLIPKDRGGGPGMSANDAHTLGVDNVVELLILALAPAWAVRGQSAIDLGGIHVPAGLASRPEPDAVVAAGPRQRYRDHAPDPYELELVVEVADSSLAFDRGDKLGLYASAGIRLYWILNLVDRQLEVYSDPDSLHRTYRSSQIIAADGHVTLTLPGTDPLTLAIADLLP